jgi:zinc-binding alcohol dehydrogenase family protein
VLRAHVWPRLESGEMKVVIHHIFPLADAAAAHRMMEEGQHVGKNSAAGALNRNSVPFICPVPRFGID